VAPEPNPRHVELVERIKSLRTALHEATEPERRNALLDELGEANRELAALVLEKEGKLKSPLE
jgi:hypothetical protein